MRLHQLHEARAKNYINHPIVIDIRNMLNPKHPSHWEESHEHTFTDRQEAEGVIEQLKDILGEPLETDPCAFWKINTPNDSTWTEIQICNDELYVAIYTGPDDDRIVQPGPHWSGTLA